MEIQFGWDDSYLAVASQILQGLMSVAPFQSNDGL